VAARLNERTRSVPRPTAVTEVDFTASKGFEANCAPRALEHPKGGESLMAFSQWMAYFRARFESEEGQTMAEYGVVLAVICVLTVGVFSALSGGIGNAINAVIDVLPGN
jgi:Flp pilus assembly pilin Flp